MLRKSKSRFKIFDEKFDVFVNEEVLVEFTVCFNGVYDGDVVEFIFEDVCCDILV